MPILNRLNLDIRILITTFLCVFTVSFLANNSKKDLKDGKSPFASDKQNRHVFFDLAANNGDSLLVFLEYQDKDLTSSITISKFDEEAKTAKWEVYGFEANAAFNPILEEVRAQIAQNHSIQLFNETAAWIYDGTVDFYLDDLNFKDDKSSLIKNRPEVLNSGQKVTIPCKDISQFLKQFNESDLIVMKIDIKGGEYDLLLDFMKKDVFKLIDYLAVEFYPEVVPFSSIDKVFMEIMKLYGTKLIKWH